MPNIKWKHSERGGWFYTDEYGNYWRKSDNGEIVTVITQDGREGTGWTERTAWNALDFCA